MFIHGDTPQPRGTGAFACAHLWKLRSATLSPEPG
jgi:hypothetical protein